MSALTKEQLEIPAVRERLLRVVSSADLYSSWVKDAFLKPPRFRKPREVHSQRARKLRRRGEYVHFVRWEHGHCIYVWGSQTPKWFVINRMPRKSRS